MIHMRSIVIRKQGHILMCLKEVFIWRSWGCDQGIIKIIYESSKQAKELSDKRARQLCLR